MTTAQPKKLSGRTVLIAVVGFFTLVIGMNALMASYALGTFDGTTEPDAYRKGLDFNARIVAQQEAAQLGWELVVDAKLFDAQTKTVRIDVAPEGMRGPALTGQLWRQTADGMDVALPLSPNGDGTFTAIAQLPALGRWELRVTARSGGKDVKFRQELQF